MWASIRSSVNTSAFGEEPAVLIERVERLLERPAHGRQLLDLFGRQVVQVAVHGLARIDLPRDAVEPGHEQRGEREIGIGGGVGEARLDPLCRPAASANGRRIAAERLSAAYASWRGAPPPGASRR